MTVRTLTINPFSESSDYEIPLTEFIAELQDVLNDIPPEYRAAATFTYKHVWGDDESSQIYVAYDRPETVAEAEAVAASALADRKRYEAQCERDERRTLAALKAKYETPVAASAPPSGSIQKEGRGIL